MSEFVVIRLTENDGPVDWLIANSSGAQVTAPGHNRLEEIASIIDARGVIVLVPAEDVISTTVSIPARAGAKIRTALPFAMEEDLAEDIEDLHFAIGQRKDNGRIPVAVVAREKLRAWVERLAAAGIEASKIVPINHGLAKIPGTLSLIIDDDLVMFNDGEDRDFVMASIKPSDVLVLAGELDVEDSDEEQSGGHVVAFCTAEQDARLAHDWIVLRHEMHSVDVNILADSVFPKLAVTVAAGNGINLLQNEFGRKTEYSSLIRPWRIAAALLLAFGALALVSKSVDYYQLQNTEVLLRDQFTAQYREIKPDDTREVVDPGRTIESLRRSLGGGAATQIFLPSIRELAAALAANPDINIETISYRAGVVDLRLTAPNVATLDNIQKAVSASGRFQASIQRTDQIADRIDGRIQIREGS